MSEERTTRPVEKGIRIQYYHSFERSPESEKEIVRSLGFTTVNQILAFGSKKTQLATELAGKVPHLLRIIE